MKIASTLKSNIKTIWLEIALGYSDQIRLEIFIILLVKLEHIIVIKCWGVVLTTVNNTVTVRCAMSAK